MKGLQQGWITFIEFREKYQIKKDGGDSRKLKLLPDEYKQNLGTESKKFWILKEEMTCIRFRVNYIKEVI